MRKQLFVGVLAFVSGFLACSVTSCTAQQRQAVSGLAEAACVVIDVFVDSPEAKQVCAYERELRPFVEQVLRAEAKQGSGAEPATVCVDRPELGTFRELRPEDQRR